jgi:hypothetical protein
MGKLIFISVFLISVIYESFQLENRKMTGFYSEKPKDFREDYESSKHRKSSIDSFNIFSNYLNSIYKKYADEFDKYVGGFKILINDLSSAIQKNKKKITEYEYIEVTDLIKEDKMNNDNQSQSNRKSSNRNLYDKSNDASEM